MFNSLSMIELDAEGSIYCRSRRVVAQMIRAHGAVDIVENVVDAQFQSVCQNSDSYSQHLKYDDAEDRIGPLVRIIIDMQYSGIEDKDYAESGLNELDKAVVEYGTDDYRK